MHTYRYNPLFHRWVLLGTPVPHTVQLEEASLLLSPHKGGQFLAAEHPEQPFLIDPPAHHGTAELLHQERPPVGEYELMLHTRHIPLHEWGSDEWSAWLHLLVKRLRRIHGNPHLHHVQIAFHTGWCLTTGSKFQRVGDIIATSHEVAGAAPLLSHELLEKLRARERNYILHDGRDGTLYVPSAPQFEKEVWYVPHDQNGSVAEADTKTLGHTAEALALLMKAMIGEWRAEHFVLEVHTSLANVPEDSSWWIRVYQEARRTPATLTVVPMPEKFARDLGYVIGPSRF
jgi:hypothetical protein